MTERAPLTTIPPSRATGSGLGAAVKCTVPSPWPLFALTLSHAASGAAVHWHSRAAETVMLPLPPAAGIVAPALPTVRAHLLTVEGGV